MDLSKMADEIIRDLCEKPVPELERYRLHDALTDVEHVFDYAQGNEVTYAERIVNRPEGWGERVQACVEALAERYGYGE